MTSLKRPARLCYNNARSIVESTQTTCALSDRGVGHTLMPENDPAAPGGIYLTRPDCLEMEKLFEELVETAGMVLPMLELASTSDNDQRAESIGLAKESSARASLVMKKLLWKWGGLRRWAKEEAGLRSTDELFKEFRARLRDFNQGRGVPREKCLRAVSGKTE